MASVGSGVLAAERLHGLSTRSPPGLHVSSSTSRHPPRNIQHDEETDMSGTSQRSATGHAVVLGAGMAGLFAARVLSEQYARVTLIDRDPLPAGPGVRRGVPQARHVHGFQARGVQVVEELFPGLVAELVEAGASKIGDLSEAHFRVGGHLLSQRPQPIAPVLLASRPYLEYRVRSRVEALPNVRFRDCLEVAGLMHESACDGDGDGRGHRSPRRPARRRRRGRGARRPGGRRQRPGQPDAGVAGGAGLRAAGRGADRGPGAVREPDAPPGDPGRRPAVRDRGPSARAATSASRCSGASAGPGPSR